MANYILKNDKVILRCSNWAMEVLYENLLKAANDLKLTTNSSLMSFIEKLDQNTYGRGSIYVDLARLTYMPKMLETISILASHAIEKIKKNHDQSLIDILGQFQKNIV